MGEWVKVKEIARVHNLVKEQYIIDNTKKEWDDILKDDNIEFKYEIFETTEYTSEKSRTQYGSQLTKIYVLELYIKKEYLTKVEEIILNLNKVLKDIEEPWELQEAIEDDENEKQKIKLSNIMFVLFMIVLIGIQIAICVGCINDKGGVGLAVCMGIFIIFELLLTRAALKKE